MGIGNASLVGGFLAGLYAYFDNKKPIGEISTKSPIMSFVFAGSSSNALTLSPRCLFSVHRLNIEIYIDARSMHLVGNDFRNWDHGVGIGGVPIISGMASEFFSLRMSDKIPHWLKGLNGIHRLISFFELPGNYAGSDYGHQIVRVIRILCGWGSRSSRIA